MFCFVFLLLLRFVERYDPNFAMWIGSGNHYSFLNQPKAASMNFKSLVKSLLVLLSDDARFSIHDSDSTERAAARSKLESMSRGFDARATLAMQRAIAAKLGLGNLPLPPVADDISISDSTADTATGDKRAAAARSLWSELEPLMAATGVDWTIFWRQLAHVAVEAAVKREHQEVDSAESCSSDDQGNEGSALSSIRRAFFPQDEGANTPPDSHAACKSRAAGGECATNPGYMLSACARACKALDTVRRRARGEEENFTGGIAAVTGAGDRREEKWLAWLRRWLLLRPDGAKMLLASPKYIPREWMLVKAYEEAAADLATAYDDLPSSNLGMRANWFEAGQDSSLEQGQKKPLFQELHRLQKLFREPYAEQSDEFSKRYYRLPPKGSSETGGVGFMS